MTKLFAILTLVILAIVIFGLFSVNPNTAVNGASVDAMANTYDAGIAAFEFLRPVFKFFAS